MSNILVSGSLAYDRIMDFPGLFAEHFVPEKMHSLSVSFLVEKFSENFGGTAGNIAYSLALLGEKPIIISTAGSDFAKYHVYLEEHGIDPSTIHTGSDITSSAYIMTDKADNQIAAFYPGAGKIPYGDDIPLEGAALAIVAAGCDADIKSLPRLYRKHGLKYLYDAGQHITALTGTDLLDAISGASVLFANDYELGLIVFKTGLNEMQLLERVPVVVATLGDKGARLLTKEGETLIAAVHAPKVVDPTGAGDAHRAGFIKGMLLGKSWKECAQLGSVVAAYAVEHYGTQAHQFSSKDIAARYAEAYKETIAL
jgi:adenosine kinase